MAALRIPSGFRDALIQFASLSDDQVDELCTIIESNPEILTSRKVAFDKADLLTKLDAEVGFSLLEALIPLLYLKAEHPTSDVAKDVGVALTSGEKKGDSKLPKGASTKFEKYLARILSLSAVTLKAKALSIAMDNQRIFSEAKVISDMRPVFGEEVSSAPLGMVILHSLKVQFAENGEEQEFFVSLNSQDLKDLQACISRALEKEASLAQFAGRSKVKVFDTSI